MTPRKALAPAMALNSNNHETGASVQQELTLLEYMALKFRERIAKNVKLQKFAPPENLPEDVGFAVENYTWWQGNCVHTTTPVGRRFVLLKRELRSQSNGLAAVKLTYSMYGRDDQPLDDEDLYTLPEPSGLSGASTICTQNFLAGGRA